MVGRKKERRVVEGETRNIKRGEGESEQIGKVMISQ